MFYKYDETNLLFKKDSKKIKLFYFAIVILMIASFVMGRFVKFKMLDEYEKELIVVSLDAERNKFTEERFIQELKNLNVKFPYIVMAQSILETGNFKSQIFKENHNLFGMKQATLRINTAKGTQYSHAYYDNWKESLYDYAFYQCRYLSDIQTEEQYYIYLSKTYAEAADKYVVALKDVIQSRDLKKKFE